MSDSRLLSCRASTLSAVSPSNTPAGSDVRLFVFRYSSVTPLSPLKSPAFRLVRPLSERYRAPVIFLRCLGLSLAQLLTLGTASRMASCTLVVRSHTLIAALLPFDWAFGPEGVSVRSTAATVCARAVAPGRPASTRRGRPTAGRSPMRTAPPTAAGRKRTRRTSGWQVPPDGRGETPGGGAGARAGGGPPGPWCQPRGLGPTSALRVLGQGAVPSGLRAGRLQGQRSRSLGRPLAPFLPVPAPPAPLHPFQARDDPSEPVDADLVQRSVLSDRGASASRPFTLPRSPRLPPCRQSERHRVLGGLLRVPLLAGRAQPELRSPWIVSCEPQSPAGVVFPARR